MSTRRNRNVNGPIQTTSLVWLRRVGVFALVACGLFVVGWLAITQIRRKPPTGNHPIVSATIEASNPSRENFSLDAWRAEILSPATLQSTIAELHLDQGLLPRSEQADSPSQWQAKVHELLQVEQVRDRRHSDHLIRIAFPVGRNVSQAVALVNGLAVRAVASREDAARKAAMITDRSLAAKRAATVQVAQRLQQLQSELVNVKKVNPPEKNSIAVETFFAERRAKLSQELAEHQRRREVLLETLLPAHPEVRGLDSKIESIQAGLAKIPPAGNPTDTTPGSRGADLSPDAVDAKLLADVSVVMSDWQKLASEQAVAEQQWLSTRELASYVVTLAQAPVVQVSEEKPSTAVLLIVVLAAVVAGIAAAGWVRSEPIVLRSAREIERSLHLKVLAVLPLPHVKI